MDTNSFQFNFAGEIRVVRIGIRGEGTYHTTGNSKIDGRDTRGGGASGFFGGSLLVVI
jgi:hypothetical protein